jgi:23S rRNA (pseudouridine1915-N3)-methyltransferase
MKINVIIVDKKGKDRLYAPLVEHFIKISKPFGEVTVIEIFNKEIAKAQDISPAAAKKSYSRAFEKYLSGTSYSVALDPSSKELDSMEFAELFKNRSSVNLFIGGAYGLEEEFLRKCNTTVSLGKITLSHKLVKVVVLEQIFRALSINNHHPYHK